MNHIWNVHEQHQCLLAPAFSFFFSLLVACYFSDIPNAMLKFMMVFNLTYVCVCVQSQHKNVQANWLNVYFTSFRNVSESPNVLHFIEWIVAVWFGLPNVGERAR